MTLNFSSGKVFWCVPAKVVGFAFILFPALNNGWDLGTCEINWHVPKYGKRYDLIKIFVATLSQTQCHRGPFHGIPHLCIPSTTSLAMLPVEGDGIWTEVVYLYPNSGFKEHCNIQKLFFYLCSKISMSREGPCLQPGLGMDKVRSRAAADPQGQVA